MAVNSADFNKIWASTSPLTPYTFSDNNYKTGWNFVGATPPSRQMWDFIQKKNDEKSQYLFEKVEQTSISNDADLNDYTSYGNYFAGSDATATSLSNCPTTSSFNMMVGRAGAGVLQWLCAGGSVFVRKRTSSSWNQWHQMLDCNAGGTLLGNIVQEQSAPNSRNPYIVKYTNITRGVSPTSSAQQGYQLSFVDKDGNAMGGIRRCLYVNGTSELQFNSVWSSGEGAEATDIHITLGMKIDSNRYFLEAVPDNTITLGEANYRWKQLFAGTSTINTSDERVKDNIEPIDDAVLDAWGEVGWYQFQFKDAIAKKGESARIHTGTIAQRIKETFEKHNLDAFRYGLLCYDSWDATEEEKDENGKVTQEYRPAGDLYSLRYEEALCMESAYQRRRADRLEARLNALEERIAKLEG